MDRPGNPSCSKIRFRSLLTCPVACIVVFWGVGLPPVVAEVAVNFDVSYLVSCREVTSDQSWTSDFQQKLVEADFQISTLIRGKAEDLVECLIRIESLGEGLQVADYHPRTTLISDVAGRIGVEKSRENSYSLGIGLTGKHDQVVDLSGNASSSRGKRDSEKLQYELQPPLELVAASGTTCRGTGVYFKLRPSTRSSLEGGQQFKVVFLVSRSWRADSVGVVCEALGRRQGTGFVSPKSLVAVGRAKFRVALHLAGDESAKRAAEKLVFTERRLRASADAQRREIKKRSQGSLVRHFSRVFSVVDPKIPDNWLDQMIDNPARTRQQSYVQHLSQEVLEAASHYEQAKSDLSCFRG